jgi:hypothetical protein
MPNGDWIFTTWLGFDPSFSGSGLPFIFQTAIQHPDRSWTPGERYSTETDALTGHLQAVDSILGLSDASATSSHNATASDTPSVNPAS